MEEDFDGKAEIVANVIEEQGEDVQVYYLSVPETGESQVLDISNISNLLAQEGIQIVETQVTDENGQEVSEQTLSGSILLSDDGSTVTDQTAAQSAHALLKLSKSQGRSPPCGQIKVLDMLDASVKSSEVLDAETVELSTAPGTATYIVDENGTMIPLEQYRPTGDASYVHVEEEGVSTIAICTCWCGKEFISQEDLDKHNLIHDKPRTRGTAQLKCELCSEVFTSQSKLANHHRVIHPDGMPWECPVCFRRFSKKLGLKVHLRAHSGLKQHKCTFCERSFSYKNALLRHMKLHTKDKPYKCSICGEGFTHLWAMRRHRATHKPANLYHCDVCSKTFKQKQTLFIHARIHTGHKPYSCEICRKSFTLKSSLNQHLRIHTGERPKVCPLCNKAFRQTSTLKSHMKLHTHMKPHKCRYCKTRFSAHEEMLEHELVHLKDKSWNCEECGMRFRNQSLLSRHVRKHTNERPFQCKICGKSFSQSGSLQSHMRTHTKEKPYQCRLCPKTYTTSGTLLIHIRRAHGLEAKKVKDVFPSANQTEDQKIFTIRSHASVSREGISIGSTATGEDIEIKMEESMDGTVLTKDGILLEDLVGNAEDIISQDGNVLIQRINLDANGCDIQSPDQAQDVELSQTDSHSDGENKGDSSLPSEPKDTKDGGQETGISQNVGYSTVKELMTKRQIKPCSLTLMNIDGFSRYKVIDMENEKENSLYAQARQEAALGLAELSLVGGIVVSEKRAGTTSRTVAREVEDNRTEDPNVTKIILSKEGGIMNSQDPHQCPECKRIFGRKSIMVEHRRIHTDEKPYECDFCFVRFRQSAQLSSHIRNKHTKAKKYQCSFCQKNFLSRGITIRHINFHHKLKVRLCESIDPNWTVDEAIICDEKYEVIVKGEPDIIQDEPVSVLSVNTQCTVSVPESSESKELLITMRDVSTEPLSDTLETKSTISTLKTRKGKLQTYSIIDGKLRIKEENSEDSGADMISKSLMNSNEEAHTVVKLNENERKMTVDALETEELVSSLCKQELVSVTDDSIATGEIAKVDDIQEASLSESRLVCETCAMQFRGIASLRWHLRKVHQTTLAESDVSFVYEDEDPEQKAKDSMNYPLQNDGEEQVEITITNAQSHDSSKELELEGSLCASPALNKSSVTKSSLKCCICNTYFRSRVELEEHLKSHGNDEVEAAGLHRCDTCSLVMKNTQQISKHIIKVHGVENVYGCSICDKEFLQESTVLRHMKYFHKWEMKIRGEGNIPVLLKPAPPSLHASSSAESIKTKEKVRKGNPSKRSRKDDLKVSSREENNVTFLSLEVGDLENLQLYREDGKKVQFEVVKSTDEMTTIRIKDLQPEGDSESDQQFDVNMQVPSELPEIIYSGDVIGVEEITASTESLTEDLHTSNDSTPGVTESERTGAETSDSPKRQSNIKSISNEKGVTTLVVETEALQNVAGFSHHANVSDVTLCDNNIPNYLDSSTDDNQCLVNDDDDERSILEIPPASKENTEEMIVAESNPSASSNKEIKEDLSVAVTGDAISQEHDSSTQMEETESQSSPKVKTISVLDKSLLKEGVNKATGALLKASSKQSDEATSPENSESSISKKRQHTTLKAKNTSGGSKSNKSVCEEEAISSHDNINKPPGTSRITQSSKTQRDETAERRSSSGRLIKRKKFSDEEESSPRSKKTPRK